MHSAVSRIARSIGRMYRSTKFIRFTNSVDGIDSSVSSGLDLRSCLVDIDLITVTADVHVGA